MPPTFTHALHGAAACALALSSTTPGVATDPSPTPPQRQTTSGRFTLPTVRRAEAPRIAPRVLTDQPFNRSNRYLLWLANYDGATPATVDQAVGKYAVAVFNADRRDLALRLRAADPQVRILVYLDAASARTYDGDQAIAAGVSYPQAMSRGWIARDSLGNPITWPYPGHVQTTVWDAAYQRAWTDHAAAVAAQAPWDGILMDNDLATLRYYSPQLLAGTSTQEQTDLKLRAGLESLINQAGPRLNSLGKELVPNISEGRLDPARWRRHVTYGGGMEENFMAWTGSVGSPTIHDWGPSGWFTVVDEVATTGRTLAMTNVAHTDTRTQLYGYASFLLRAEPGDAWAGRAPDLDPAMPSETSIVPGRPSGPMMRVGEAYTRSFAHAWVAVNPTLATQVVPVPAGVHDMSGAALTQVSMGPMTGVVARR